MKGLIPFERTKKQTTEAMPLGKPLTILDANNKNDYKLRRVLTLSQIVFLQSEILFGPYQAIWYKYS